VLNCDRLAETKALMNYAQECIYILAVGRVVRDKGIVELIDAFIALKNRTTGHKLKLIVLGPMEELRNEELLPKRTIELLLNHDDITHIQWSDHVEYFMVLADILVHASYREGFPNVLLQAGAMKCPIVCSKIPGNIDIVTHKLSGLLFEKRSAGDLTEKLEYALKNPMLIKKNAGTLRAEIEEKYDRSFVHKEYLKFYREKLDSVV
jgi:glycosyltransferase involved in cell wall biosynthesis